MKRRGREDTRGADKNTKGHRVFTWEGRSVFLELKHLQPRAWAAHSLSLRNHKLRENSPEPLGVESYYLTQITRGDESYVSDTDNTRRRIMFAAESGLLHKRQILETGHREECPFSGEMGRPVFKQTSTQLGKETLPGMKSAYST